MYAKTLTIAALAAVASAQIPAVARRDFVEARQTGLTSLSPECQSAVQSILPIYTEIPTPAADLESALPTDPCESVTFTGSLSAEYASYSSAAIAWYTSHSSELLGALSSCAELSQYATEIPVCSTVTGGSVAATTGTATGAKSSGTSTATGAKSSGTSTATSVAKNFAARETGFVAAAVAAAGFVGAVAAL
jgi:hypothetical protein